MTDELYRQHRAAGAIDHPPLSIAVLALLRRSPATASSPFAYCPLLGAATIVMTGLIARSSAAAASRRGSRRWRRWRPRSCW
jgi:hypothetical protein